MDGFSPAFASDFQNLGDIQVRFAGWRRAKQVGFIGFRYMQGAAINVRKDSHRSDAHFAASAHHANGDFTTIGNEYLAEHSGNPDCNNKIQMLACETIIDSAQ
jgi:hypothetical protein